MTLLLLLATVFGLVSDATAQEYRKITLADGRALVAMVESTLADGMLVRIPQGLVKVPFADVRNLEPVESSVYASQRSWGVVVLPLQVEGAVAPADVEALRQTLVDLAAFLPAVQPALSASRPIQPGRGPVETCGLSSACAARMGVLLGADVVLSGTVAAPAGGTSLELKLVGTFTMVPTATASATVRTSAPFHAERAAIFRAVQTALGLQPDASLLPVVAAPARGSEAIGKTADPNPAEPKASRVVDAARLRKLAWVPVPGLPSMVAGDGRGVALSWGLVVPSSAAIISLAGHASFTSPQFLATSVLGTCFTTVAINHAVGARQEIVAAIAPMPGGGALIQVGVTPASR